MTSLKINNSKIYKSIYSSLRHLEGSLAVHESEAGVELAMIDHFFKFSSLPIRDR
jgi:hypothetical protein